MKQSGIRVVLQWMVVIGLTVWCSCGGGGGGVGITPSISYSGIEAPAIITGTNAESLAVGAFLGVRYAGQSGDITSITLADRNTETGDDPAKSIFLLSRVWEETAVKYLTPDSSPNPVFQNNIKIDETIDDDCGGGDADVTGSVDDQNGDFDLNVTFNSYSDDCLVEISGRTNMKGNFDLGSLTITHMTVIYEALSVSAGGMSLTQSGVWSADYQQSPARETFDMVTRDESTGKTYWMKDFEVLSSSVISTSDTEYQVTGRYYDPDIGYVDLSTEEPMRFHFMESYPYEGLVMLSGDANTAALAEFVSNAAYRITCDEDGDGQFDDHDTGIVHWPGENNPPVAVALDPVTAGLNCTVTLDGSTSYDEDTDPIGSYSWSVVSIPPGSLAALSDPNSPTPTFVPDVEGEYQFRLTINDGIDNNVPWGLGCGVVNDDLACVSVDAFFGCPYEGMEIFDVGSDPEAVAIGDVNGDGRNDVVMTTGFYFDPDNDYKLFVFPQNVAGYLGTATKYSTASSSGNFYQSVAVGNLNSNVDSRMDVVVGSSDGIGIFYQNGSGGLDSMITVSTASCSLVRVMDVNDDNRVDIVGLSGFGTDVTVITQTDTGSLDTPVAYSVDLGGYNDLELGDVNNDGLTDIIAMSGQDYAYDNIGILYQNMSGTFDSAVYYDLGGDETTNAVGIGDLNNDGRNDVAVTLTGDLRIFYQNVSGTLDSAVSVTTYGYAGPVDVADINDDGLEDIVSIQVGWQHLEIIRQQGGGTLGPDELYLAPFFNISTPHSLAVGDIDGNGINDVVRAEPFYGLVVLYDSVFN